MELRYWISKELSLDVEMERIVSAYGREIVKTMSVTPGQFALVKPQIIAHLKNQVIIAGKMTGLEIPIETVVQEIAEIDPVFAFELKGKYQVTAIIEALQAQLAQATPENGQEETIIMVIQDVLRPALLQDLFKELNSHILVIAGLIDKKTHRQLLAGHTGQAVRINETELNSRMSAYVKHLAVAANTPQRSDPVT